MPSGPSFSPRALRGSDLSVPRNRPLGERSLPQRGEAAFTLIEMIGVLAVIAILVAALLPAWIRRIDMAVRTTEVQNLVTVSNALVQQVLRNTPIPGETTWTQAVSDWTLLPANRVAENPRRYTRLYYHETGASPAPGWTQTSAGLDALPQNQRAMIVSILGGDTLTPSNWPQTNSGEFASAYFDALWSLADNTKPPTGAWANWNGRPEDLVVQRVTYAPLFHHLVLVNRDTNATPVFTINGSSAIQLNYAVNNTGWAKYYLDGTVVNLGDPAGNVLTSYVLDQDISFVWEAGKWRAEILGAPESNSTADDFAKKAAEFLAALRYDKAFKGGNQQGVVTVMYSFMLTYTFWAEKCPRFPTYGIEEVNVPEFKIIRDLGVKNGRLDTISANLIR